MLAELLGASFSAFLPRKKMVEEPRLTAFDCDRSEQCEQTLSPQIVRAEVLSIFLAGTGEPRRVVFLLLEVSTTTMTKNYLRIGHSNVFNGHDLNTR